jgi:hypothetical protein
VGIGNPATACFRLVIFFFLERVRKAGRRLFAFFPSPVAPKLEDQTADKYRDGDKNNTVV